LIGQNGSNYILTKKKIIQFQKKLGECQTIMPLQEKEITKELKPWPIKRIKAAISHSIFRNWWVEQKK
jgi:hypothetical protein